MPSLNNNLLDDPIEIDSCPSLAGGQHSFAPADQLNLEETAELQNIDINLGLACTRRGTAKLGVALPSPILGLAWFETASIAYLVAATAGALHSWDGSSWEEIATIESDNTAPVSFVQLDGKLYLADGIGPLRAWDGATLTTFDSGNAGNPPIGSLLLAAQDRLWLAGVADASDTLYVSHGLDTGNAGWSDSLGAIRIGAGDGDPITGLAALDASQIVVFKRNSIYLVRALLSETSGADEAAALSNAVITKISDNIGCVAPRSISRVGSDLWFLSSAGVYNLGRVTAQTDREVKQAISWPVNDVIERIQWSAVESACAIYHDHRCLLSLPLDDGDTPSHLLVYHTQQEGWSGTWTGWNATSLVTANQFRRRQLFFARGDGAVCRWLADVPRESETEKTFQDAGINIATRITSRAMTLGDSFRTKSGLSLHVDFAESRASAQVAVRLDEEEPVVLGISTATSDPALIFPIILPAMLAGGGLKRRAFGMQSVPSFRTAQAVISSPAGKLSVRSLAVSGFLDSVKLEE